MTARNRYASNQANALIVVAKRPAPGQTKTRLTPPLLPMEAAALYDCFLRDTLDLMRCVPEGIRPLRRVIAYSPDTAAAYFSRLAPDFEQVAQQGSDLGARLDHALTHYLNDGCATAVIMNSDGPTLPQSHLVTAFAALDEGADVVLGPCDDGGYYLIGLKRPSPRLLREVRMSTSSVVGDTLALAAEEALRVKLLPAWYDVDDVADLERLVAELAQAPRQLARNTREWIVARENKQRPSPVPPNTNTTVIIPALNEAGNIRRLVQEVIPLVGKSCRPVVVVDNGSTDGTAVEAAVAGAQVVSEPRRGYGYACAAGIAAAPDADILLFLDGDHSFLPSEIPALLAPILANEADLVLGSRWQGHIEPGAMPPQQRFGNWLVARLMNRLYGLAISDLGPYRAIRRSLLDSLQMREMTFGWPAEMMVKAAWRGGRIVEVPVTYRRRQAGRSKVSGTVRGTLLAAWFILGVTLRYSWKLNHLVEKK